MIEKLWIGLLKVLWLIVKIIFWLIFGPLVWFPLKFVTDDEFQRLALLFCAWLLLTVLVFMVWKGIICYVIELIF